METGPDGWDDDTFRDIIYLELIPITYTDLLYMGRKTEDQKIML